MRAFYGGGIRDRLSQLRTASDSGQSNNRPHKNECATSDVGEIGLKRALILNHLRVCDIRPYVVEIPHAQRNQLGEGQC